METLKKLGATHLGLQTRLIYSIWSKNCFYWWCNSDAKTKLGLAVLQISFYRKNKALYLYSKAVLGCLGPGGSDVDPEVPDAFVVVAADLEKEVGVAKSLDNR